MDTYRINHDRIDAFGIEYDPDGNPSYPIAAEYIDNLKKAGILIRDKQVEKDQQKLNRIRNLTIGRSRCYELDRLAMELEVEADLIVEEYDFMKHPLTGKDHIEPAGVDRVLAIERFNQLKADALYLRRLEYDLLSLNNAVNDHTSRAGKYDPDNWRGERP